MSDEVHGGLTLLGSLSGSFRIPAGSAANAGGYFTLSRILFKNDANNYYGEHSGSYSLQLASPKAYFSIEIDGVNNAGGITIGYSWAGGGQGPLIFANASGEVARFDFNGSFGLGATPAAFGGYRILDIGPGPNAAMLLLRSAASADIGEMNVSVANGVIFGSRTNTNVQFSINSAPVWRISTATHILPIGDNTQDIAAAANRLRNLYLGNSPTVTSDEREKTWRGAPTEAELRAAKRIIAELGFYQWNDAVAEKGKDARFHFGARAQRVWQIMAEEKLVAPIDKNGKPGATPYAFLCWDEWDETTEPEMTEQTVPAKFKGRGDKRVEVEPERLERVPTGKTLVTREAGNRYGLRVDQFTLFLVAAQEARLAALEAAIAG